MADMKTFRLLVNTPDRVFYNDDVTMVELSTTEGEIGVYAEHIPLTSVLVPCVMNRWRCKKSCCTRRNC